MLLKLVGADFGVNQSKDSCAKMLFERNVIISRRIYFERIIDSLLAILIHHYKDTIESFSLGKLDYGKQQQKPLFAGL